MSHAQSLALDERHSRTGASAADPRDVVHTRRTLLAVVPDDVCRRVRSRGDRGSAVRTALVGPVVRMHPLRITWLIRDGCRDDVPHIAGKMLSPPSHCLALDRT